MSANGLQDVVIPPYTHGKTAFRRRGNGYLFVCNTGNGDVFVRFREQEKKETGLLLADDFFYYAIKPGCDYYVQENLGPSVQAEYFSPNKFATSFVWSAGASIPRGISARILGPSCQVDARKLRQFQQAAAITFGVPGEQRRPPTDIVRVGNAEIAWRPTYTSPELLNSTRGPESQPLMRLSSRAPERGEYVAQFARSCTGAPWRPGCNGELVRSAFASIRMTVSSEVAWLALQGEAVAFECLLPGDLVFFQWPGCALDVGVALSRNAMVCSLRDGSSVQAVQLAGPLLSILKTARRLWGLP